MDIEKLSELLQGVGNGNIAVGDALERLRTLPIDSVGDFAQLDTHRALRNGIPEVVFSPGKSNDQMSAIVSRLAENSGRVMATRATMDQFESVRKRVPHARYHELSRLITVGDEMQPIDPDKSVAVLTAGTADTSVGEEAALTLEWHGIRAERLYDVGVAGLHRLLSRLDLLQKADVIIVCAGMEGALASVVGGLVSCPVVAVPTSIGYGASFEGLAALLSMLNACAGGIAVVNIDNGFGAAIYAQRILSIGNKVLA